jgi:hypothetical protein
MFSMVALVIEANVQAHESQGDCNKRLNPQYWKAKH